MEQTGIEPDKAKSRFSAQIKESSIYAEKSVSTMC